MENRTLTLVVSGTKFTGRLLKAAISKYMDMSSANDEKVVNPPQKPVIRKTFIDGEMTWVFSGRLKKMPITKLPIILTANVPHGNAETVMTWASFPVRKRRMILPLP